MIADLVMTVDQMKDRTAWLKLRNTGLGGSDAATIVGKNPYKGQLALWMEKTGQMAPEDLSGNQRVYWGSVLEAPIAEWFARKTGKKLIRRGMMRNRDNPYMLASVDREVVGERAGLEIKTAGVDQAKKWERDDNGELTGIPDAYYIQCLWYMAVTGFDRWYIAVLIGGNEPYIGTIQRKDKVIDDIKNIIVAGRKFWQLVQDRVMPDPDATSSAKSALEKIYTGGAPESIKLDGCLGIYDQLKKFEEGKIECEFAISLLKNQIMAAMGDHELAYIADHKVTWKTQNGRTSIDTKKLKADLPAVWEQYKKVGKAYRVFKD